MFLNQNSTGVLDRAPHQYERRATAALKLLADMGLFIGQSSAFFELMRELAEDADDAQRGRG